MNKGKRYFFTTLSLIIGLFFASGLYWVDYKMIAIFGVLLIATLLLNNDMNWLLFIFEIPLILIFLCRLSVVYSFETQILIGKSFQIIFQVFVGVVAIFVFAVNIIKLKREW